MMPWRTWAMNTLFLVAAVVASIAYLRASLDARVMIEVAAGLGFRLLLCVVGPMRRCSGHWLVQYGAMAAYYLPSLLVPRIIAAAWYSGAGGRGRDGEVATLLSGYCAYLVAFHPELLPGQRKTTTRVLQDVLLQAETKMSSDKGLQLILQKARALLGMPRTMPEKQEMLKKFIHRIDEEAVLTTFEKGIKLGRDLVERDTPDARSSNHKESWTVMAEFWVETILYVAPSRNAAAHVDRLAQGGEFVTHLWAFLSDVGVVEREGHRPYQRDA
ncbi:hypothetical protein E2562_010093 [Oryza meyeriana var. granulata]|uniref:DUF4220 domain-containing protein n=1 Tax=Oryza meyeriana var. granulata TaxID=110450 RepID=A0A6G1EIK6_9ORYZ|nr:hypothetical protein E2562_004982 [Oryza meyeriana var. granulata]KAF0924426.1 hypothetical protein E2562_010093 [Oryza meyeriana var. granulata]